MERNVVGRSGLEKRGMEDIVHALHREGEPEAVGMRRDLLYDGKGTDPLEIQLLGRASGPQIACIEPDQISDGEGWNSGTLGLGAGLILSVGDLELLTEEPLDIS